MPELDGPVLNGELVRRKEKMEPRFVFMTGDTLTLASREFLERREATHGAKPFDQQQLRTAVDRALTLSSLGATR